MLTNSRISIALKTGGKIKRLNLVLLFGAILFFSGLCVAQASATQSLMFISSWLNLVFSLLAGLYLLFCLTLDDYSLGKYRLVLLALGTIATVLMISDFQDSFYYLQRRYALNIQNGNIIMLVGSFLQVVSWIGVLVHLGTEQAESDLFGHNSIYGSTRTFKGARAQHLTHTLPNIRSSVILSPSQMMEAEKDESAANDTTDFRNFWF